MLHYNNGASKECYGEVLGPQCNDLKLVVNTYQERDDVLEKVIKLQVHL